MKLSEMEKRAPCEHLDSAQPIFMVHMADCAHLTRKDFQYGMRVSKTLVKEWFEGEKHDPLKRARDMVGIFREAGAMHLIPTILEYIAGSDFEGAILTEEEQKALAILARRITPGN